MLHDKKEMIERRHYIMTDEACEGIHSTLGKRSAKQMTCGEQLEYRLAEKPASVQKVKLVRFRV